MKIPLRTVRVLLVNHQNTSGDPGPIEQVCGKTDDAFNIAAADEFSADVRFPVATEKDTVRQNNRAFTFTLERGNEME